MTCLKTEYGKVECPYLTGDGIEKCYACNNDCANALSESLAAAEKALGEAQAKAEQYRQALERVHFVASAIAEYCLAELNIKKEKGL